MTNPKLRFKKPDGTAYPDWEEKRLGECFTERVERSKGNEELLSVSINNGVTRQSEGAKRDASSEDKKNYKVVHVGDIAYNTMRMWQGAEGRSPFDGIVSPAYTIVVPVKGVADSCFFEQFFKNGRMIKTFERHSQGLTSDTWNLKFDAFSKIKVKVPSIEEQGRVVEGLASVDEKIEAQEQYVAALETQKKELLRQVFTREIRFKDENGQDYPEWATHRLGELCSKIGSGKTPKGGKQVYADNGVIFIRSQNVLNSELDLTDVTFISDEINSTMLGTMLEYNDVLLNITGASIGRCCLYNKHDRANVNQHVCIIRLRDKSLFVPKFVEQQMISDYIQDQLWNCQNGGSREGLNFQQIADFTFWVPSLPEQQRIADFFTALDAQIENERALLEDWRQLKKGLLQQMFI